MKTVLVVDDSAIMRRTLSSFLAANGYEVIGEATNGRLGVEKYSELNPDIVSLDVIMDEMNGLDALKRIREINPNANVIMVSSMGQDVIVRDAILLGAKNFLLKPFNEKQVVEAFSKL